MDLITDSSAESGTNLNAEPIKAERNSAASLEALAAVEAAALADVNTEMPVAIAAGNCFANEMTNAMWIPFINWQSGHINCPGNEVWYKFTANVTDAHPKGSPGWYTICTNSIGYTNFDTVLYLYDSPGNQIAYNDDAEGGLQSHINARLTKYQTYYIRLKGYGSATGFYHIRVSYLSDDHGDSVSSASSISGVYYTDASVEGHLHSEGDMDYFSFVPARDCVMKIYTDGSTDTTGILYNECGSVLYNTQTSSLPPIGAPYYGSDNDNGNGNFAIYARLDAYKFYYIAVRHSVQGQNGNYTLKTQFLRDYNLKLDLTDINDLRTYVFWYPSSYFGYGSPSNGGQYSFNSRVFLNRNVSGDWFTDVVSEKESATVIENLLVEAGNEILIGGGTSLSAIGISPPFWAPAGISVLIATIVSTIDESISNAELQKFKNLRNQQTEEQYIIGDSYNVTEFCGPNVGNRYYKDMRYSLYYDNYFYGYDYQRGTFSYAYSYLFDSDKGGN